MVLHNARNKIQTNEKNEVSIQTIVDTIVNECKEHKNSYIKNHVLSKYNLVATELKGDPNTFLKDAKFEVDTFDYPFHFKFLIAGLDIDAEHTGKLFTVDEDGDVRQHDQIGFAVIGSGSPLAFSDLTKHNYNDLLPFNSALIRVYLAKFASERASGVGNQTHFGVLYYDEKNDKIKLYVPSNNTELENLLINSHNRIIRYHANQVDKLLDPIDKILKKDIVENTKEEN